MKTSPEFENALRRMVEAWDRAERSPRDVQLRRRAFELTGILVALAKRELDDPPDGPSDPDP